MQQITKYAIFLVCLLVAPLASDAQKKDPSFIWGINGHPLTQHDYKNNLDTQIYAMKDLNVGSYRFDVILNSDGYAKNEAPFLNLLRSLKQNTILPLPVVMQTGFGGDDPETVYQKSLLQGQNFGSRYGEFLSVIEVNNEGDNKIRLRDGMRGQANAYDETRSQRLMAEIKGFIEGIRKVVPAIKITLSVSFTHYYYLQLLQDNNIQYDIIGCHWYSNMGDITNVKQSNVLVYLSRRFNKPVWITEFNRFKGTGSVDFASQNDYITKNIQKIMAQGIVKAIFIYELFDQPALAQRDPAEAHYGLMLKDPTGQYIRKDAYRGFKQLTRQ